MTVAQDTDTGRRLGYDATTRLGTDNRIGSRKPEDREMPRNTQSAVTIEQAEAALDRAMVRIETMQSLIDSYADSGKFVPSDVTSDYEEAVTRAIAFADAWGFDHSLDC